MSVNQSKQHAPFLRAFTLHEAAIRAYVRRLVPSRADADDVMQEVAVILWDRFGEFRPDGNFRAWAFGVAKLKVLSWLRDKGRSKIVLADDVLTLIADEAAVDEPQLDEQRQALESCVEKLEPSLRDLLLAAYQPDTKVQDVAKSSGRSTAGFYQWLHRMRRILLDCIQSELRRLALA